MSPWVVRDNELTETSPSKNRARGLEKLPVWEGKVTFSCLVRFLEWYVQESDFSVFPQVGPVPLLSESLDALLTSLELQRTPKKKAKNM